MNLQYNHGLCGSHRLVLSGNRDMLAVRIITVRTAVARRCPREAIGMPRTVTIPAGPTVMSSYQGLLNYLSHCGCLLAAY